MLEIAKTEAKRAVLPQMATIWTRARGTKTTEKKRVGLMNRLAVAFTDGRLSKVRLS
jgi:hypothetical protein